MNVRFQYCSKDDELMLFIILEKDGEEIERLPLYLSEDAKKLLPELSESIHKLYDITKLIYNSGVNQEKINFIKEDVSL